MGIRKKRLGWQAKKKRTYNTPVPFGGLKRKKEPAKHRLRKLKKLYGVK